MSAGAWSVRPGRFPSMVQGTQGRHQGAWNSPLESARTQALTPASVERVTSTRVSSSSTSAGLSTCPCSRAGRSSSSSRGRDGPSLLMRDTVWRALSGQQRLPFFS